METTKALFFKLNDFHSERWNGIVLRAAHGVLAYRAQIVHASYVTGGGGLFEPLAPCRNPGRRLAASV
jgi:hypothetical protein